MNTAPSWAVRLNALNQWLTKDLFGGPRHLKWAWAINLHKGLTLPVVLLLMIGYQNFSVAAWVYLGLHGGYGICWLIKHWAFPDRKWEARVTYGGAAFTFLFLATYWLAPYLLISDVLGSDRPVPPAWRIGVSVLIFVVGVTVMAAADSQKTFALRSSKTLLEDGLFRYVRHPNYLGEMMLYGAFALLVGHWIPWAVLAYWWMGLFWVNMKMIEASISRYPGWEAYKSRTSLLLPWKMFSRAAR